MVGRVNEMKSSLTIILTGIAALLSLLGGAIILGLMLAAVTERRREIAMRRALGASGGDVLCQFLLETLWCALLGGLAGALLGTLLVLAATRWMRLPAIVSLSWLAWEIGLAAGAGLMLGLYPAWRAARLDPVQALRIG
jgi:putative ABC transport system permease protein